MSTIRENLKKVNECIANAALRANRNPEDIVLVAVSKTVDPARIKEGVEAGIKVLGENRIQEAEEKIALLGNVAEWHLVGHLQSNKAKDAVNLFTMIHSIDKLSLAQEVDKRAKTNGRIIDILVEVNLSGEETKFGVSAANVIDLMRNISNLNNLRIRGLMTIPPFFENPEFSRPFFRQLKELSCKIKEENIQGVNMDCLSMGMSGDFEVAIEEGATMVRIGTAIFGARP